MIGFVFGLAIGCVFTGALLWMVATVAVGSAKRSAEQAVQAATEAKAAAARALAAADATRVLADRTARPAQQPESWTDPVAVRTARLKAAAADRRAALLGAVHGGLVQLERHKRAAAGPQDSVPPGFRAAR
ncbi:hypothetical protein ACFW1A_08200 [Kitasatospora sp. NPDC058965]|uniref:hypothetical protein n=1 Tax=Kitasatospora sp. NPDC058965 TaxID=3346682 RepID=UPI0036CBFA0B